MITKSTVPESDWSQILLLSSGLQVASQYAICCMACGKALHTALDVCVVQTVCTEHDA